MELSRACQYSINDDISSGFWNLWESSLGSSSSSRSSLWSVAVAYLVASVLREGALEGSFTAPRRRPPPWWHRASIRPPIPYNRLEWSLHPQLTSLHLNNTSTQTSHLHTLDLHCRAFLQARVILQSILLQKAANSQPTTPIWYSDNSCIGRPDRTNSLLLIYLSYVDCIDRDIYSGITIENIHSEL